MSHIKTWQERKEASTIEFLDLPVGEKRHMLDEIAELRAALLHAQWCAEVNRDGRNEEVAALEAQAVVLDPGPTCVYCAVAIDGYCAPSSTGECSCRKFGADPAECSKLAALSDEEIHDIMSRHVNCSYAEGLAFARAILATQVKP